MADDEVVKGTYELIERLSKLAPNIRNNAERTGMFRAAQLMAAAIKERTPVSSAADNRRGGRFKSLQSGDLKRSIKAKRGRAKDGQVSSKVVGAFYAKFVERGHTLKSKGGKSSVGHVPANPFVRRAFESVQGQVVDEVKSGLVKSLQSQFGKLQSKLGGS